MRLLCCVYFEKHMTYLPAQNAALKLCAFCWIPAFVIVLNYLACCAVLNFKYHKQDQYGKQACEESMTTEIEYVQVLE